jgi:hypothetical protein
MLITNPRGCFLIRDSETVPGEWFEIKIDCLRFVFHLAKALFFYHLIFKVHILYPCVTTKTVKAITSNTTRSRIWTMDKDASLLHDAHLHHYSNSLNIIRVIQQTH